MTTTRLGAAILLLLALCPLQQALNAPATGSTQDRQDEATEAAARSTELERMTERRIALLERAMYPGEQVKFQKCAAEFIAMALFVFFGCGTAMSVGKEPGSLLQVSLSFGLLMTVLMYALGHYSGAQINCAVTWGLMLQRSIGWGQGILNIISQLLGSVFGAVLLKIMYPAEKDGTGTLHSNFVSEGWTQTNALVAEFVATFLLMFVVFETAVNPETRVNAFFHPIAIGFAVFLAHSVLLPVDGCSINPTRSFGPAVVQALAGSKAENPMKDMWVFWVGPLAGATTAMAIYCAMHGGL